MAQIRIEAKNRERLDKKPRVYFTCHPADFETHFGRICGDLWRTHDCAVYYTPDMTEAFAPEDMDTDLGRNNLFVVPVTARLLNTPNRAMDADIPYALQKHIPVLPIMMEAGLDNVYSQANKFGQLQYLNPTSTDTTEISYADKLKKYLEAVLISDETAKRIRAAFDCYIFLSYRKKDRRYANELMRLIHSQPECRDIAIWFDEFLTPGESFKESIDRILHDSKLFALLVTPNLLEEPEGKPNFVMGQEYPAARAAGLTILPAEMAETDKAALAEKFTDIPDCMDPADESFRQRLLETVSGLALKTNNTPEHTFLMGLAYLDGIDVEVDRVRALELITDAAQAGLPEAIKKLYRMYDDGIGVPLDYRKAVVWAEKYAEHMISQHGELHKSTLTALSNLASTYTDAGNYQKALELKQKVYDLRCMLLGPEHPQTMSILNNLAMSYGDMGQLHKELEMEQQLYDLRCKLLGPEHPDTLTTLNNLAATCSDLGDHNRALELKLKAYDLRCKVLGEEHPKTITVLSNLGSTYGDLGQHQKALEVEQKAYDLRCKVLGPEHPDTLISLNNLATSCDDLGDYQRAMELKQKVYDLRCKVLGETHPRTLSSLNNLAYSYGKTGNHEKALEVKQKVYDLRCETLGPEHPDTLTSLNNVAYSCSKLGNNERAAELDEQVYALRTKVLGPEHPDTLTSLANLADDYKELGQAEKALELSQRLYDARCKTLGPEHPKTLTTLNNLALRYGTAGQPMKELELTRQCYDQRMKVLGEENTATMTTLSNLAICYRDLKCYREALPLFERLYELRCKLLGEDDPKTERARKHVETCRASIATEEAENIQKPQVPEEPQKKHWWQRKK